MEGARRELADALRRVASARCSARAEAGCRDATCVVAAFHDALARGAWDEVAAQLAPDVAVESFGARLPGLVRIARGAGAAVELLRANEAAMRWSALELEGTSDLGETLVVFHLESGSWSREATPHRARVVSHYLLRDGRLARIRTRSFPVEDAPASP